MVHRKNSSPWNQQDNPQPSHQGKGSSFLPSYTWSDQNCEELDQNGLDIHVDMMNDDGVECKCWSRWPFFLARFIDDNDDDYDDDVDDVDNDVDEDGDDDDGDEEEDVDEDDQSSS